MPTVGSFLAKKANQITEKIGDSVMYMGHSRDPIWRDLAQSSAQVTQMGGGHGPSRGYRIRQRFQHRTAGVIEGGAVNNHLARDGDSTTAVSDILYQQNAETVWPDPTQSGASTVFGLTADLYSFRFNMPISFSELKLDMNDANIAETVAGKFEGAANLIQDWATNQFYTNSAEQYRLASLPASGNVRGLEAERTVTFEPTNEASFRFNVGMTVDLWSDATTRVNETGGSRIPLYVESVDLYRDIVTLVAAEKAEDGSTYTFLTVFSQADIDGGFVTFANQFNTNATPTHQGMFGYHDFFKYPPTGSSTQANTHIFGDQAVTDSSIDFINVLERPEFRSAYWNHGGYLTERDLKHYLTRTKKAMMREGYFLDTLIAGMGLVDTFDDLIISKERIDRTGQPSSLSMGFNGEARFLHDGQTFNFATSMYLEKDRIIGLRRANNFAMATLPRLEGSTTDKVDSGRIPLEFVADALTGNGDPKLPVMRLRNGVTVPTDMAQLPAQAVVQFMPQRQIPGLVIEGITNNRVQGDALTE